ncbi:MAG: FecR domain-containing protein, partial [Deltaproteobacteria bacterium]|nr:FecR domain-containing protein [Deltaproteobacteria bacterium]
ETIKKATRAESRARAAADLVLGTELLPGPVPLPDFVSLMAGRARWRRRSFVLGAVGSLAVVALAALGMLREAAPVSYVVDGTVAIADGIIDASGSPTGAPASVAVHFSEGTEVILAPGARLRVVGRTARGAALALDRGGARFAVTHRSGARWSVATGPFIVEVIGTRFSLDWSPRDERLVVDLTAGSVQVRGASVGGPVAMRPGERLIATAGDRRVTLSPLVEAQQAPDVEVEPLPSDAPADNAFDPGPSAAAGVSASATPPAAATPSAPSRVAHRSTSRRMDLALATPSRDMPSRSSESASSTWSPSGGAPTTTGAATGVTGSAATRGPDSIAPPTIQPPATAPALDARPPQFVPQVPPHMFAVGGGGAGCEREHAQYRFERMESGISVPDYYTLAFSNPRPDRSHSWCGQASLRVDASFNDAGRRNFFGRFAKETGQVVIKLHRSTDLTGKTVSVHFFVDGPADARFTAELVAVNRGRWVSGPASGQLVAGRWWTISHRFEAENESGVPGSSNPGPFPVGGTSPVTACDRLGLAIHSTGARHVWTGAVYVDDVAWK